jgi:glycine cleavage system H protein
MKKSHSRIRSDGKRLSETNNEFYETAADKFIFKVKKGLLYTRDDVWAKQENGSIRLGITDFIQRRGGDIVYVQLPKVGNEVRRLEDVAQLETIKTVIDIKSPLQGTVSQVNDILDAKPERINEDPYGEGWLLVISPSNMGRDKEEFMTDEKYFELMKARIQDELKKKRGDKDS